jgi:hypothetical protein
LYDIGIKIIILSKHTDGYSYGVRIGTLAIRLIKRMKRLFELGIYFDTKETVLMMMTYTRVKILATTTNTTTSFLQKKKKKKNQKIIKNW